MNNNTTTPCVISVDWFQVTCMRKPTPLEEGFIFQGSVVPGHENITAIYELSRSKEFNPIYAHSLAVLMHGFQLATIMFDPRPSTLASGLCSIKVANRLLYSGNWLFYLHDILSALGWRVCNIGRVDVCADFKEFSGHLSPYEFIRRFLYSGELCDLVPTYVRVGSNKYTTMGRKSWQQDNGETVGVSHENDYLRFGSRSTGVSVYLYCKSKELTEVHDKPYITDLWVKGGLYTAEDLELPDEERPPIFRLEISINSAGLQIKRKRNPEDRQETAVANDMYKRYVKPFDVDRLSTDDFMTAGSIENLFWAYANKYFRFKEVGRSRYKKDWNDVRLFDVQLVPSIKPYTISRSLGTGVSERNAMATITRLMQTIRGLSLPDLVHLDQAAHILERYSSVFGKTIDREQMKKVAASLKEGFSFEEIGRMHIASAKHLEQIKQMIYGTIINEMREIMTDSDVARAVSKLEAERALIAERAEVEKEWSDKEE